MTFDELTQRLRIITEDETIEMGHYRFARRLLWLIPHLHDAASATQEGVALQPARRMYAGRHGAWGSARNVLFQLQALARIYRKTHRDDLEIFDRLKADFKALEDALGGIDYFDEIGQEARTLGLDAAVIDHLDNHKEQALKSFEKALFDDGWITTSGVSAGSPNLERILKSLDAVQWRSPKKDRQKILKFFNKELDKVIRKSEELDFDELEDGVHEFRRTARWISIYAQSLGGLMELTAKDTLAPDLVAYHGPEIVNAPYTKYPHDPREGETIGLDASLIYAFNWLISTIGDIKDDGQLEEALVLAMVESGHLNQEEAHASVISVLSAERTSLAEIPEHVAALVQEFIDVHQVPQRLKRSLGAQ